MKAGLYVRVSTTEQAEEGHSIDAQLDLLRGHCARMGWEVVGEFVDAGVSGKRDQRPELDKLMRAAKARRFEVVVVHKLDRFYRNLRGLLAALDELRKRDVAFVSITENFDLSSPWGKMAVVMMGILAEIYLDNLTAETSKGKRQRAKKGLANSSILPFGYRRDEEGKVVVDPAEADGVRLAFETYAAGGVTIADIALLLNQHGYRTSETTRFGSRPWSKDTVNGLLRNRFYAGLVQHKGEVYPGQHAAIIPRELWEKSAIVRAEHTCKARSHRSEGRVYLLAGLLYCDACGGSLRAQGQIHGLTYYRDTARERGLECPRSTNSVRGDLLDQQIGEIVSSFHLPQSWQERVLEQLQAGEEQRTLEAERKRIEERVRRLRVVYLDGGMTDAECEREKRQLQLKLDQSRNPEVDQVLVAGEFLQTLGPVWERATAKERRDMVRIMFDAVYVDIEKKRISGLVPKPVFKVLLLTAEKNDLAALRKVDQKLRNWGTRSKLSSGPSPLSQNSTTQRGM